MATTAEEIRETIQRKQQEVINLRCDLTSDVSDVGDYKIVKTYEARLKNEADPYDTDALIAARQAKRDAINQLEAEIAELDKQVAEAQE